MKKTIKETLKKLEAELAKDEGAWLKSLGSIGDLCRLMLKLQEDQIQHTKEIEALKARLKDHEEDKR